MKSKFFIGMNDIALNKSEELKYLILMREERLKQELKTFFFKKWKNIDLIEEDSNLNNNNFDLIEFNDTKNENYLNNNNDLLNFEEGFNDIRKNVGNEAKFCQNYDSLDKLAKDYADKMKFFKSKNNIDNFEKNENFRNNKTSNENLKSNFLNNYNIQKLGLSTNDDNLINNCSNNNNIKNLGINSNNDNLINNCSNNKIITNLGFKTNKDNLINNCLNNDTVKNLGINSNNDNLINNCLNNDTVKNLGLNKDELINCKLNNQNLIINEDNLLKNKNNMISDYFGNINNNEFNLDNMINCNNNLNKDYNGYLSEIENDPNKFILNFKTKEKIVSIEMDYILPTQKKNLGESINSQLKNQKYKKINDFITELYDEKYNKKFQKYFFIGTGSGNEKNIINIDNIIKTGNNNNPLKRITKNKITERKKVYEKNVLPKFERINTVENKMNYSQKVKNANFRNENKKRISILNNSFRIKMKNNLNLKPYSRSPSGVSHKNNNIRYMNM